MSAAWDAAGRFDFRRRLGEGFDGEDGELRAIDRAVARWVLAHGGSMLLARVAAAASRAEGEGDSVLVLAGDGSGRFIAPLDEDALVELAKEALVASVEQAAQMATEGDADAGAAALGWAFVLDGVQFYLRRSFAHEQALAGMLRARREGTCAAGSGTGAGSGFGGSRPTLWDAEAAAGSGKTRIENEAGSSRALIENEAGSSFGGSRPTLWDAEAAAGSGKARIETGAGSGFGGSRPTLWDAGGAGGLGGDALESWIDPLFAGDRSAAVRAQRAAVAGFADRRLFVLTGGPGTGKTTTVLRMLLLRLRAHQQRFGVLPRLRLAAPTGKAAQRLAESLQSGASALRAQGLAVDWAPALDHVLAAEAGTLHRLLGSRGPARGHAWHRGRRLPLDLLVIDEASMVDLAVLRASVEALPEYATVLLVGDAEQLASVGTGSVLRDLVEALQQDPRGDLVRLQHSFRAEAALQPLNSAIAAGDAGGFAEAAAHAGGAFALRAVKDARGLQSALVDHAQQLHLALEAGQVFASLPLDEAARAQAITRAHAALRETQLLCALRQGPFGALACDAAIDVALKRRLSLPEGQAWYPGRAVIVLQNDYAAGLFNGDIGLCLRAADGSLRVWFEARGVEAAGLRGLAPGALPLHGGGFALSVHKSQGSEYGEVALLLPPDPEHPILGRALLYTGATRARRALSLWSTEAALRTALSRPTQRVSGLAARLLAG
ncbi:MAG: exodeoxyribonuclease V subunit alpha [Xanthomonadales bacterium]|nr:exodeoxyribonuclease V subunit alpha [Xanthomonadales bacterium]